MKEGVTVQPVSPILERNSRGHIAWARLQGTPEMLFSAIELEAKSFIENGHALSQKQLIENGRADLVGAIRCHYPGKMYALKANLGIEQKIPRKPERKRGYWRDEANIGNDLNFVVQQIGHFPTQAELKELNLVGLSKVISRTGGTNSWRERLGYEVKKRSNGYWQDEDGIRNQLEAFLMEHDLSDIPPQSELVKQNPALLQAISKSGGFLYWKRKMGIKIEKEVEGVTISYHSRISWKKKENTDEENEAMGITNIQSIFLAKFPEFKELFPLNDLGTIDEEELEDAKRFILDAIGSQKQFVSVFGASCLRQDNAPYFKASFRLAVRKSFEKLGVTFENIEFSNKIATYTDEQGVCWVSANYFKDYKKQIVKRGFFKDVPRIKNPWLGGGHNFLYNRNELSRKIEEYQSLPTVRRGIYIDENSQRWRTANSLARSFSLDFSTVIRKLESVPSMNARSNGRTVTLFNEESAVALITEYINLPQVDPATGYYEQNGERWAPANNFRKQYLSDHKRLSILLEGVFSTKGRDVTGQTVQLYNCEQAKRVLEAYLSSKNLSGSDIVLLPNRANEQLERLLEGST